MVYALIAYFSGFSRGRISLCKFDYISKTFHISEQIYSPGTLSSVFLDVMSNIWSSLQPDEMADLSVVHFLDTCLLILHRCSMIWGSLRWYTLTPTHRPHINVGKYPRMGIRFKHCIFILFVMEFLAKLWYMLVILRWIWPSRPMPVWNHINSGLFNINVIADVM